MSDVIEQRFGAKVVERQISIHELINSDKEGRLLSVFGDATHCPLLPISRICYKDTTMLLNLDAGKKFNEELNQMLYEAMAADPSSPWIEPME